MRRPILNLVVFVTVLTLTLSFITVLPAASQDKERIISELEKLRGMVEREHPCLANKVNATINQIEAGAFNGALNKLVNDVNKTITAWVENPAEIYIQLNKIVDLIKGITPPTSPSPNFEISAHPEELEIEKGKSGTSTIKVKSLHGFSQRIDLSAELTPTTNKVTLALTPTWVIPTPSGNTSALAVAVGADAEAGEYIITVTGTNGTLPHSKEISLKVTPLKDFCIEASPASLTVQQGGSNLSVIVITSLAGFSRPIDLDITSSSIPDVNARLNPLRVIPPPDESAVSILTIDAASTATTGSYTITVKGTSGSLWHCANIMLEIKAAPTPPEPPIPDFSIVASKTSLTVQQGDSDTSTIIIASLNGFSQAVVLTVTSESISGVDITPEPSEVTPVADGFATSTLTVEVDAKTPPGEHIITVVGTSDALEPHSVNVSLKVVVEKTPPVIVSVLRQPEKPSYNETVTVLASVTDAKSGVKDVVLSFSGSTWKNETMTLKNELYRATIPAFRFNTPVKYRVYASDNVGNWATPSSIYSYVVTDQYPPVIGSPSWSPEKPVANEEITINVTVTEPLYSSGVENVTLWYVNTTMTVWLSVPMTFRDPNWTATITNQSDTVVTFYIEAFDKAGNKAETEEQEFTVAAPAGIPLAWILLIILILVVLIGSGAYLLWRRRQRRRGAEAALPPTKPTPPSPPPVTPAKKPAREVALVKGYGMVSFVVPAHNEEGTISQRIARAYESAASHAGPSEIIVVDDGSIDDTYEAAWSAVESNRKKWPNIPAKVVKLSSTLGREEAVRFGRSKAKGEFVETVNRENALTVSGFIGHVLLPL